MKIIPDFVSNAFARTSQAVKAPVKGIAGHPTTNRTERSAVAALGLLATYTGVKGLIQDVQTLRGKAAPAPVTVNVTALVPVAPATLDETVDAAVLAANNAARAPMSTKAKVLSATLHTAQVAGGLLALKASVK